MGHRSFLRIVPFVAAVAAWGILGCSKPDARQEVVGSANGENIKVLDVRESLGMRGGAVALPEIPIQMKREALDRVVAVRLLAQEARSKGLDNTDEFRSVVGQNTRGVLINALFRREVASRAKVSEDDIKAQGKKLRESNQALSEDNVNSQARRLASEEKLRKIEEELIASARKEFPVSVSQELVGKVAKGEKLPDNAVLGTAGGEKVTYAQTKMLLNAMGGGAHGAGDLSRNPAAIARLLDRETTGLALAAYARKQGIEGSEWAKDARADVERLILVNFLAENEILKGVSVSEKEIAAAYAEHANMFVRDGGKIPLSQVKPQIRDFLMNEKRRKAFEAYVAELKKKAKITVNEDVLAKV